MTYAQSSLRLWMLWGCCGVLDSATPRGEFAQPVHVWFGDLEKTFDHVLQGILRGVLWDYGVSGALIWAVRALYDRS